MPAQLFCWAVWGASALLLCLFIQSLNIVILWLHSAWISAHKEGYQISASLEPWIRIPRPRSRGFERSLYSKKPLNRKKDRKSKFHENKACMIEHHYSRHPKTSQANYTNEL
jgi:hypothetical protein